MGDRVGGDSGRQGGAPCKADGAVSSYQGLFRSPALTAAHRPAGQEPVWKPNCPGLQHVLGLLRRESQQERETSEPPTSIGTRLTQVHPGARSVDEEATPQAEDVLSWQSHCEQPPSVTGIHLWGGREAPPTSGQGASPSSLQPAP